MQEDPRLEQFCNAAIEAFLEDRTMRVVCKGGETLEGVPQKVVEDASQSAPAWAPPDIAAHFAPVDRVVTINGTSILAQEVERFEVLT